MTKIKVLCGFKERAGGSRFEYAPGWVFTQDRDCRDYDWLVVFDEMPVDREELVCPREHTILATWEPVSIKSYSRAYTRQFGHLLTNRPPEAENHPNYFLGRGYYLWFSGRVNYVDTAAAVMPAKTRLISTVCSSKQMRHTSHHARYRLVERLSRDIPELDWYGQGVRPIYNKYDALDAYKYHVAVENHIGDHHWTEKLSDAFLSECLPFYAGDPTIFEVFPEDSIIPIPIDDPGEAARIIAASIAENAYEKRREAVMEAKRLVLSKYNFWAQVIELIKGAGGQTAPIGDSRRQVLYGRHALRLHSPGAALEDAWMHVRRFCRLGGLFGSRKGMMV